jgi:hypothetical protein
MADLKISALTAATTPLAGTEVLPIVQGGVTTKVAVSDLTAGRAVTAASVNKVAITAPATASTLTIADGKTLAVNDNATLGTGGLTLGNSGGFTAAASKVLTANNSLTLAGTDSTTQTFPTTSATIARTDAAQTFTGDQTLATGNLIVSNGKGIDFSATSGTGTSELFNDYEEGDWTPAFTFVTPGDFALGTPIVQTGKYTKVGRQVTCNFALVATPTWTTASSYLVLTGLPFTVTSTAGPGFGPVSFTNITKALYTNYTFDTESSGTRCYLTGSSNAGLAGYSIQAADMVSGTQTVLSSSFTYTV